MMARKTLISSAGRTVVLTMITALALTTSDSPLVAAPASHASVGISAGMSSDVTDFSSSRRHRHYHRGGNAAGLAFMGFAFGTIAGAIAAQQRRDDYYYYGGGPYYGPGYYYGEPYYYGRPYYGRRYYYRY